MFKKGSSFYNIFSANSRKFDKNRKSNNKTIVDISFDLVNYHIFRVDKSVCQPHQKSIIVIYGPAFRIWKFSLNKQCKVHVVAICIIML